MILAIVTMMLGLTLKSIKIFPNRYIPLVTLPFCAVAYALMGNPKQIDHEISLPRVMLGFYGFIDGFVAWMGHRVILSRFEKYIPWLKPAIFEFDSAPPIPLADGSNTKTQSTEPKQ